MVQTNASMYNFFDVEYMFRNDEFIHVACIAKKAEEVMAAQNGENGTDEEWHRLKDEVFERYRVYYGDFFSVGPSDMGRAIESFIDGKQVNAIPRMRSHQSVKVIDSKWRGGQEKMTRHGKSIEGEFVVLVKSGFTQEVIESEFSEILSAWMHRNGDKHNESYFKSFFPTTKISFESRAVGLWMYDYCMRNACGGPTASKVLKETGYLQKIGMDKSAMDPQNRSLLRLLSQARECVARGRII